jgi:hypothetical protein
MFVILTSKPGQFTTELSEGMQAVESYDYLFCGRKRARFVIAEVSGEVKIRIVDDSGAVNLVPSKFLPRFDNIEKARRELGQLARFNGMDIELLKVP